MTSRPIPAGSPWRVVLRDADYPADPYPGSRPDCSYVHLPGGVAHRVSAAGQGSWTVAGEPLDGWLAARGATGLDGREAVLAYGSNACPSKISWLRSSHGLAGPVVVLRCRTVGISAVWCAHPRVVDDQLPAVLVPAPGRVEEHAVWLATADQRAVLDRCEGRGDRHDLVRLGDDVEVRTEDGVQVHPYAYLGASPRRAPLLRDGTVVPVSELDQAAVRALRARRAGLATRDADQPTG